MPSRTAVSAQPSPAATVASDSAAAKTKPGTVTALRPNLSDIHPRIGVDTMPMPVISAKLKPASTAFLPSVFSR